MRNRKDVRDRVAVSPSQSSRTKIFSVRRVLTWNQETYRICEPLMPDPSDNISEGLPLATRILELNGVTTVVIAQYDIWVTIGRAFDWQFDDLEKDVSMVIRNYLSILNMEEDISDMPPKDKKKPKTGK